MKASAYLLTFLTIIALAGCRPPTPIMDEPASDNSPAEQEKL
ncbi:hypothetical protein ACFLQY_05030 [Verrucomicrobiota bacterium]